MRRPGFLAGGPTWREQVETEERQARMLQAAAERREQLRLKAQSQTAQEAVDLERQRQMAPLPAVGSIFPTGFLPSIDTRDDYLALRSRDAAPTSKTGLFIGLGLGGAALAIIGVIILVKFL